MHLNKKFLISLQTFHMEDNENPSPEYVKGFNYGYIIANIPGLAEQLSKNDATSGKFLGVKHGIAQYQKEFEQSRKPDWLSKDHLSTRGNRQDRDKDNIDRD